MVACVHLGPSELSRRGSLRVSQGFWGTREHWQNIEGNKGTLTNFWEQGNKIRKISVRKHSEIVWEHGNIGQFWKGTREQGPPLGDPRLCVTGRFSYGGHVKGEGSDENRHPGRPGWGFGVGLTTISPKKSNVTENLHQKPKLWQEEPAIQAIGLTTGVGQIPLGSSISRAEFLWEKEIILWPYVPKGTKRIE